jgi:threonine/homoserine/homoserine lactone efflux protein
MDLNTWLVYAVAAIGLSLTPGPNGLLVLSHGIRFGIGRASYTAAGGVAGFLVLVAISLAGLGVLLATSERAFTAAKWIGAAYLVYLGIRTWRAAPPAVRAGAAAAMPSVAVAPMASARRCFVEGFLVAVTNPKALIFFAAFLPQFMQPGLSFGTQFVVLGGTFAAVELVYEVALAGAAQRVAPWLGRHGRTFNRITGATFVAIGGVLAAARR